MKKRVKMQAVQTDNQPVVRVGVKKLGVLEYSLQADGTWLAFLGEALIVPVLEISGPDPESIALHLQDLREQLGCRDTHNVRLFHCSWRTDKLLRLAIGTCSAEYKPGRLELADVLIENYKHRPKGRRFEVELMRYLSNEVGASVDQEVIQEVSAIAHAEAEE